VYLDLVTAHRPHVVNGRTVDAAADGMSKEERAALENALERSVAQADAGELVDANEVLDELRRR
jgi:predicted transcriptional regulator